MLIDALTRSTGTLNVTTYNTDDLLRVKIECKERGIKAVGLLASPVSVAGVAEWQPLKTGNILGEILSGIDTYQQLIHAKTIYQPWIYRKLWKGSKPISMQVDLLFTCAFKGLMDSPRSVLQETQNLLGLIYPREIDKGKKSWTYRTPGPALTAGLATFINEKFNTKLEEVKADSISVEIMTKRQQWAFFESVYPESMKVDYSLQVDKDTGEPMYAKLQFKFSVADVINADVDGSFKLYQTTLLASPLENIKLLEH